jgi:cyclophilin family peptidyl-prolyl cis-trans isomerase
MDNDTKMTYFVVLLLITSLGLIAYFLQAKIDIPTKKEVAVTEKTTVKPKPIIKETTAVASTTKTATSSMDSLEKVTSALITTNLGTMEVSFATNTPRTVENFAKLAQSNFYDGVRFHRVIKDFMIQAGDPLSKDASKASMWGTGGPGYTFADELTGTEQYSLGTLAMANAGQNTNGSQFFIVTANPGYPLPPNYTVFGKVTGGIETALKIQNVKTGQADRPLEDVIIEKIELR